MDSPVYRFGTFLIDPAKRILVREGVTTMPPPKAFDVIVYLLERRERVVGRDELIAAVWGKVDITNNALGQVVLQARRALDDSGDGGQLIIRTVSRFGYRWIAPVERIDAGTERPSNADDRTAATAPRPSQSRPEAPRQRARRAAVFAAAAAGVLAVALAFWRGNSIIGRIQHTAFAAPARSSVIVLPVMADVPATSAWVRLGVMDLVAQRLRAAGQMVVPSDNVIGLAHRFADGDGEIDAQAMARAIGATDVIEASAQLRNGRWLVVLRMPGRSVRSEAGDGDVIVAARIATDRLALALGLQPPDDIDIARDVDGLLQQVRAAILSEQLETARALLLDAGAGADAHARPDVRYHLAEIDFRAGRLDEAEHALKHLLDSPPDAALSALRARILNTLANIAYQRNDFPTVEAYADQALRWLATRDEPEELGRALIGRASARVGLRRYDEAIADFANARVALEAAGDSLALARVDAYLGLLDINRDRIAEALPVLHDAVDRLQTFDAVVEELHTRVGIVLAELSMLDPAAALAQCPRLHDLSARVTDPRRKNYAGIACIDALMANGRFSDAASLLREVRARSKPASENLLQQSRIQLARVAAELALATGDPAAAAREAASALELPSDFDSDGARARLYLLLQRAQLTLGQSDTAAATATAARQWKTRSGDRADVRVHAALVAAEHALAKSDTVHAQAAFAEALAAADASRIPANLLAVVQTHAGHLLEAGDLRQAGVLIGRVAPWSGRSYDAALLQVQLYHALGQSRPWQTALHRAVELAGERAIPSPLRSRQPTASSVIAQQTVD